jgi:hypothetical protein
MADLFTGTYSDSNLPYLRPSSDSLIVTICNPLRVRFAMRDLARNGTPTAGESALKVDLPSAP